MSFTLVVFNNKNVLAVCLFIGVVSIQVGNAKTTGALRFVNQTYSIHILENIPPSTSILSVQARFASGSSGSGILYSFANGNEDSTFGIHPESG